MTTKEKNENTQNAIVSAFVFSRALSFFLKEREGIALLPGENLAKNLPEKTKSLIVYNQNSHIHIIADERDYPDGQLLRLAETDEKSPT